MVQEQDIISGRYRLERLVVSYGVEDVWEAEDQILNRFVAVKVLKALPIELSDDESLSPKEYFLREARMSAKLLHPHILPIYDYGVDDSVVYIVTAYAYDYNLVDFIRNTKQTALIDILRLIQQIASVIDFLHSQDIVHCDIKPANILLGSNDYPYIINFGLSYQLARHDLTQVDYIAGTPAYLSPEQIMGQAFDYRVDLYAFGIIIYECLTGMHPFQSVLKMGTSQFFISVVQGISAPSVCEFRPELPIGVDLVFRRLTHKNPEQRYQTATAAVDDLYRALYSGQGNIEGKVFISYATKDKDYVHKLAKELRSVGVDIWIDQDIEQGSDWGDSIENALKACDMLLLIVTEASMDSAYVNHEWSYFMGLGKPVYPFVPQTSLPENIHPRLNRLQLVQGTGDMLADIQNVVTVLAGGNPKKLAGLDE